MVTSFILFAAVCRGSGLEAADADKMYKLIHRAGGMVEVEIDSDCAGGKEDIVKA